MNDIQIIKLVVKGLVSEGWKIYGDQFIGFRAFKEDDNTVEEFDFNKIYQYEGEESDFACDFFNEECEKVKSGDSGDCIHWDSDNVAY